MPNRQPKKENSLTEEQTKRIDELKNEISKLPKNNPKLCEGMIRDLHKKISAVVKSDIKDQLFSELKSNSGLGLDDDLRALVENNGLGWESLHLVLKYLTTKDELAQYLFTHPADKDDLDVIRRRLGPDLEVLGGLRARGINVKQAWVSQLVENAPSLQSLARLSVSKLEELCKDVTRGEQKDINCLVRIAETRSSQMAAAQDEKLGVDEGKSKEIDQEKLEKAKALMNEAKEKAKEKSEEAKKAVEKKMAEIAKELELPQDWNKQDVGTKPEELLQQMDEIIKQFDDIVEVGDAYKSDREVVRKASGGRALCGIYYSEYVPTITAELPILVMPSELSLSSPNNSQQVRYMKFSESRAAANYVSTVKSSSTNIGMSVGGFYGLFVGEVSGSYASSHKEERQTSTKEKTSSASVVQYIWTATKTFKIEQEQMKLTASARKMARSFVKDEESARIFMRRYGSHYPAGLHTLGGVLFRIVDAESKGSITTSRMTEKATQQLQSQLSFGLLGGMFGIGASVSGEHSSSSGKTEADEEEAVKISYTFSSQAMGPATTNPAAFSKLLANNSTWALIDRGTHHAYIPAWELIADLGSDFVGPAKILEATWNTDEKKNRQKSLSVGYKITQIIKNDLERMKDECIKQEYKDGDYGYVPGNGAQLTFNFPTINLPPEDAYAIAVEMVMMDPRYRICEIALCAGDLYSVRCWEAIEKDEMTFESQNGKLALLYSEMLFRWKDKVPA